MEKASEQKKEFLDYSFEYIPIKNNSDSKSNDVQEKAEDDNSASDKYNKYFEKNNKENTNKSDKPKVNFEEKKIQPLEKALNLVAHGGDLRTIKGFVEIDRIINNSTHRKRLLYWACGIITFHLIAMMFIIVNNQTIVNICFMEPFFINVHDDVMMVLLGTTTANIIGLGYIVLKGIFYVDDIHGDIIGEKLDGKNTEL